MARQKAATRGTSSNVCLEAIRFEQWRPACHRGAAVAGGRVGVADRQVGAVDVVEPDVPLGRGEQEGQRHHERRCRTKLAALLSLMRGCELRNSKFAACAKLSVCSHCRENAPSWLQVRNARALRAPRVRLVARGAGSSRAAPGRACPAARAACGPVHRGVPRRHLDATAAAAASTTAAASRSPCRRGDTRR